MNWYVDVLKKYAVFTGRARRKEFWMFVAVQFVVTMALSVVDHLAGLVPEGSTMSPLANIYTLATLLPSVGVSIRRLHDVGKSGWWILLGVIPCLGILILIFGFYIRDGQPGSNEYGPNPKGA